MKSWKKKKSEIYKLQLVIYLFNNINNLSCKGIQLVLKNNLSREILLEHKFPKYLQPFFFFFPRTATNSRNRVQAVHKSNINATYKSYRSIKFRANERNFEKNVKRASHSDYIRRIINFISSTLFSN